MNSAVAIPGHGLASGPKAQKDLNPDPSTWLRKATPLPRAQLITLCLVRIVVPIAFGQVFPSLADPYALILRFWTSTKDPSQIGFFSGLVESSFAVSQLLFIYHWAWLSDRFGRRPIIIIGTLGVAIMTIVFGLSKSIPELLLFRCIAGFFAATASVVHTVLGEITDTTNQAAAFPLYGPLIGGSLSNPAAKYALFDIKLFHVHPYFLPGLVSGVVSLMGVALAYFCLDESLSTKRRSNTGSCTSSTETIENEIDLKLPSPTARELLSIPIIRALCLSGFALEMNGTSFVVLFVLFCYSPIQQGGLAFPAEITGYALAFTGFIAGITQLFLMPLLLRRFEAAKIYTVCIAAWPIVFLILPCFNLIARYGLMVNEATGELGVHAKAILWTGIFLDLALSRIGGIAYPASMILIKNNVPSPSYLGSTNGLVQWFMCLSRCVSAAFASSAFALSAKYNILGGHFWAILHACIAIVGWWLARSITVNSKTTLS
ncbi:MFS general substrate transporter [Gymnopus androsaceus JB14]|uniref:MFS general substrate transporter n=1 Tax=Gymnopus androsaceus JB14 TaxID=1447944 RepID=A0A6A4IG89_9AGAR|nr:MFS general substrate transporter [Gymnopus androsaceus JB14]